MEWVEVTGRTLEEAKETALDQLGVDEQDAEFEVLEEPRPGLFGRFRSEARVRARVLPTAPRPKAERRERRRGGGRGEDKALKTDRPADRPSGRGGERRGGRAPRAENGGRGPRQSGGSATPPRPSDDRREDAVSEREPAEDVSLAEQGESAKQFVAGLVSTFGLLAEVSLREVDDDVVEVVVTGDDLGVMIGPKGQTLQAVQELTRTVVQRQLSARGGRILVDVGGYRAKRRAALEAFTRGVAAEVRDSGVAKVLEPMPPPDRKVVHDAVNEIEGVATTSEGEEPNRRVVILPAPSEAAADA